MAHKQRFLELLAKLKEWAAVNGNNDELLNTHLNELEAEITAMADANTANGPGGNSPDTPPDLP